MKLHRDRTRLSPPSGVRRWILCLFFAAGILAGFLARRAVTSDDLSALGEYVLGYAALPEKSSADVLSVAWAYFRYPMAAFFLGYTGWGVMLVLLLCTAQGFFLSFAVHCFAGSLGGEGVLLALAALGLRCLVVLPCMLAAASDSLRCAWHRAEGRQVERRDRRRLLICILLLLTGTVAECAAVPRLLTLVLSR